MADASIINLGDISKPATVLIEKIADATGAFFKPWQIERVAKAEVKAKKIGAMGNIAITKLQRRAMQRFIFEETKKQNNIEKITQAALPQLDKDAKPEKVEEDWIANFFDKCRLISDSEMQKLWSKILAGEANVPGTFSKRTINTMSSLSKEDASIFNRLCNFNWTIDGSVFPLIYDYSNEIYKKNGINFQGLKHLESIGLISLDHLAGFNLNGISQKILVSYQGKALILKFEKQEENVMDIGKVLPTEVGIQLATICTSESVRDFEEYILNKWVETRIEVSAPYNHPPIK